MQHKLDSVLITGVAGFIGSALAWSLVEDFHVIGVDDLSKGDMEHIEGLPSNRFTFLKKDILSLTKKDLGMHADTIKYIVHLAAISSLPECQQNPEKAYLINVLGTIRTLEISRQLKLGRFIFGSTSAVYENTIRSFLSENDKTTPDLIYSQTKLHCEHLLTSYKDNYSIPISIIRFFNAYGPRMNSKRTSPPLVAYCIRELYEGKRPVLHSDGHQKRDYVYIDDIISLISTIIKTDKSVPLILNACSGQTLTVTNIYKAIQYKMKTDIDATYRPAANYWQSYTSLYEGSFYFDKDRLNKEVNKYARGTNIKVKEALGWKPIITLQEGISATVDYYLEKWNH